MDQITFTLQTTDGERELLINNRALYRFEEAHGTPATTVLMRGEMGVRAVNHFVWAGLLHEYPNLKVDEVIDLVDLKKFRETVDVILEAFEHATDTGQKHVAKKKK